MNQSKAAMNYEPEADVLTWEVSSKPIDFAKEVGNVVVHFSKDQTPVLIEVLEAKKFMEESMHVIDKRSAARM